MQQIKLIIWDLDETFWKGTLSEGPVAYIEDNHRIVKELTRRGIISSISSKNTFDDAKEALEKAGMWDFFVFPKISWAPKGELIAHTISQMQLRPQNVLFIDDSALNLKEAAYFNPGIQTAFPKIIVGLLDLEACKGKDDTGLSRLKQYRILEKKHEDKARTESSNEDFLRQSDIRVQVVEDCSDEAGRILELINRTNQLNYTKKRLSKEQLEALLDDSSVEKAFLRVRDKYGEYGVCGFYAKRADVLEHFLFSCRILNMGVENWLYRRLGFSEIQVAGECATELTTDNTPDWIAEEGVTVSGHVSASCGGSLRGVPRVLFKGGCDLEQSSAYLGRGIDITSEVSYVSAWGFEIHNEHTEFIKRATPRTLRDYGEIIDSIPFLDRASFSTSILSGDHDIYVYSVLMDYTQGLYRYRNTELIVPYGNFDQDITDPSNWEAVEHHHRKKKRISRESLQWFKENFTFLGPLSAEAFQENIDWLCSRLSPSSTFIILNGSEIPYAKCPENRRWKHHARMNRALEEAVSGKKNVSICDVRTIISSPEDHSNSIRHYNRRIYFLIAQQIRSIIEHNWGVREPVVQKQLRRIGFYGSFVFRQIHRKLFKELIPIKS